MSTKKGKRRNHLFPTESFSPLIQSVSLLHKRETQGLVISFVRYLIGSLCVLRSLYNMLVT